MPSWTRHRWNARRCRSDRWSSPRTTSPPNYATAQYGVWLDQTSNLYYKRITPEAYIQNINNLFPGERTARATQCLVSMLPPPSERPSAPP